MGKYIVFFYTLVTLNIPGQNFHPEYILSLQGNILLFDPKQSYFLIRKGDFDSIYLHRDFPFTRKVETDGIFIYILEPDYLWVLKSNNGEVVRKMRVDNRFIDFTRDNQGNFYFLFTDRQKILKKNFNRKDSILYNLTPFSPILRIKAERRLLYFLNVNGLFEFDPDKGNPVQKWKGSYSKFFVSKSLLFLQRGEIITIISDTVRIKKIAPNFIDGAFLRDTLFLLYKDKIVAEPFP